MSIKKKGLGLLAPTERLAVVFSISTLFVLITTLPVAAAFLASGLVLFLIGERRNWKLAVTAPSSGIMVLIYNLIFSPGSYGGVHWFIFTINPVGFTRGLVMSFRLMGMMFASFAWLAATPIPEMYKSLEWLKMGREWTLGILRGVQILQKEFVSLTQSLIIRGLKWNSIAANVKNLAPLAVAIIPRVVENSQKSALASASHTRTAPSGRGDINASGVFIRYSPELPDVIHGIDLTVKPEEFIYLAGKSKAGKTTLLRVIGGVIPWIMGEFRGAISVSGMSTHKTPLSTVSASARYIAADPYASILGLTVGQEIGLLAKDESEAKTVLDLMGIGHLSQRETTKLSGGQLARLVLAGTLVSRSKVLLLDSPMQELDPIGRQEFAEALTVLRQEKGTTIIVTDQFWQEFLTQSDRALILEDGALIAECDPAKFASNGWLARCNLESQTLKRTRQTPGSLLAALQKIEVTLDGNKILKGIDLGIRQGEMIAITGPNGSGKTTAMLTLAGAIKPSKGNVSRQGRVGYVFQNAALQVLAMTANEELAFGPKILGWDQGKTARFIEQGLEWSHLTESVCPLDLHPQDVRSLVIAACNTEVDTLILDEPTIGLDSVAVSKVLNLIDSLCKQGKAVVVITHDMNLASCADRVIRIEDGKIVHEGET